MIYRTYEDNGEDEDQDNNDHKFTVSGSTRGNRSSKDTRQPYLQRTEPHLRKVPLKSTNKFGEIEVRTDALSLEELIEKEELMSHWVLISYFYLRNDI